MSDRSFTAKKKYHDKRVDIYSIPGTSEVIFRGEHNKNKQISKTSNYSQNWSIGDILFFIAMIMVLAIIVYFLIKR
jgi:hypothetical protein